MSNPQPITILLAEDDDGHASLVQRNLERAGLLNGFFRVCDGQELLDTLKAQGTAEGPVLSAEVVILLDQSDVNNLVRQSPAWMATKEAFFEKNLV